MGKKIRWVGAGALAGMCAPEISRKAGQEMKQFEILHDAWLEVEDGRISAWGRMSDLPQDGVPTADLRGDWILPAFCDPHTHLVFAASRAGEFVDKINGLTYEEIASRGGGILNSAAALAETPEDALFDSAAKRLEEIMHTGTAAVEIKSGYGLETEAELKMLRVIRRLKEKSPMEIKATFLGAHAYPARYRNHHEAYLKELCAEMLPRIAAEGLADYIDVFCDTGFFSAAETEYILEAGARYGLKPKIHANELDYSGGIEAGVKYGAVSVDHLECTGPEQIEVLLHSNTMPTVLPGTAFFLGIENAPARKMIDAGLPLAMASDYNPGSCPSGSMPFITALACIKLKLLPEEALNAVTLNAAAAMEAGPGFGKIAIGMPAHFMSLKGINSIAEIPYFFSRNPVSGLYLKGKRVV
jgi:imidazolonepropionase